MTLLDRHEARAVASWAMNSSPVGSPAKLFVAALLLLAAACSGGSKTFVLGVSQPLSGDFAGAGRAMVMALQLRVAEVNRAAVGGVRLELAVLDDGNEPAKARQVAEELVKKENLVAVVGPLATPAFLAALEVYTQAKVPVLSLIEASPNATRSSQWAFSMNASYAKQAELMALYLKTLLEKDKVLLVHTNDTFGKDSRQYFAAKAARVGLSIHKTLEVDPKTQLTEEFLRTQLSDDDVRRVESVVLFTRLGPGMKLLPLLRKRGVVATTMVPSFFASPTLLQLPESATRGVYLVSPFSSELASEAAFAFLAQAERQLGREPHRLLPLAHDAASLVAQALQKGHTTPEAIRGYFTSLTWKTAAEGLCGPLYFHPDTRTAERDPVVSELRDGRFKVAFKQLVEPHEPDVLARLSEHLAKGRLKLFDGAPYHVVDVVYVGLDYMRLGDVDTATSRYNGDIFLWFKWLGDVDIADIRTLNVINRKDTEMLLLREDLSGPVKYRAFRVKETYYSPFDLAKFPFDRQPLPIYIGHKSKTSTELMLVWDYRHMDDTPPRVADPEWRFVERRAASGLVRYRSTFGEPSLRIGVDNKAKVHFSVLRSTVETQRIILPYFFNLFVPLLVILGIALLVLLIPVEEFSLRIQSSLTALLSVLVFYMSQKATLPKVGYLIKSDYYFILAFIFILAITIIDVQVVKLLIRQNGREIAARYNRRFMFAFVPVILLTYALVTVLV